MPAVVGVPETAPVEGSIDRPGGRFAADHELIVAVVELSWDDSVSGVMAEPDGELGDTGALTDTVLVMVHVKDDVAV